MDFDDLLVNFHRLLTEQPEVRAELCRRFVHVLVDEYQDVNHLQAAIVRELFRGEERSSQLPVGSLQQDETSDSRGQAREDSGDGLPPILGDWTLQTPRTAN